MKKQIVLILALCIGVAIIGNAEVRATKDFPINGVTWKVLRHLPENPDREVVEAVIREVTMYTSRVEETDSTPCISADGTNICEVGYNVCAINAYPFNTILKVDKLGTCVVKDRMNKRFSNRLDWYAKMDLQRALSFGIQNLNVERIK